MKNLMLSKMTLSRELRLGATWAAVALTLSTACTGTTAVVGEEAGDNPSMDGAGPSTGLSPTEDLPAYEGQGECAAEDETTHSPYEEWRRRPNDFGALAGTEWEGYLEAGPTMRLIIEKGGVAAVRIGDGDLVPPPEDPNAGYLCAAGDSGCNLQFQEGALYPVHGATLTGKRLLVPLVWNSPWEAFCALQTPHNWSSTGWPACSFHPHENLDNITGRDYCALGDEEVDCAWWTLVESFQAGVCRCASDACFPQVLGDFDSSQNPLLDLSLSSDKRSLIGSVNGTQGVNLVRVD